MGDPTPPDYPTATETAYKLATGQAGDVVKQVGSKLYHDFTGAAKRTLSLPVAPSVSSPTETAYKMLTGRAGEVMADLAERGLWEAGQFVENTAEAMKRKLNEPVAPAVMSGIQVASKFVTGQGGEVASNIGGRALWEVGQFAKHTVESIYGTGAPAAAPEETVPKDAPPKARAPGGPGSGKP